MCSLIFDMTFVIALIFIFIDNYDVLLCIESEHDKMPRCIRYLVLIILSWILCIPCQNTYLRYIYICFTDDV